MMTGSDTPGGSGERDELYLVGMKAPAATGAEHDPTRLLRLMVLVAGISIVVILMLGAVAIQHVYSEHVIDIAEREAVQISQALVHSESRLLLKPTLDGGELLTVSNLPLLDRNLRPLLATFDILKIKIYTPEWMIIYSTDPSLIGRVDYGNARLNRALAGHNDSELMLKGEAGDLHDEQTFAVDAAETYVPIFDQRHQVVGCFEIYRDISNYSNEVRSGVLYSVALLGVVLAAVFGFSYFVVRKGTRDLSAALKRLTLLATTDSLCMIWNRKTILRRLSEETARLSRVLIEGRQTEFSLLLIDIDHFRRLNETYGVTAGEKVLQQLAARLQPEMRDYDALGRLGAEEFLIILPDTSLAAAVLTAERLRQQVGTHPFRIDGVEISLTISIGVTSAVSRMEAPESLLQRAQKALFQAKSQGRDRVVTLTGSRLGAEAQVV